MQKRLENRPRIEIADLIPKNKVLDEGGAGDDVLAELRILVRKQDEPADCQTGDQYCYQGRKNPANSSSVEGGQAERVSIEISEENARDQKSGNNKENINPDEATRRNLRERVK